MSITICPVTEHFVAEVYDVDLSAPLDRDVLEDIKLAFWNYAVLVFPEQNLTQDQHVAFARHFGPMDKTILKAAVSDKALRVPEEIADVSNLEGDNKVWDKNSRLRGLQLGNRLWHTDSSFKFVPALVSMLYALEVPPIGGQTEFADLRAAYDALDESTKLRIEGLIAEHSLMYSRERMGYTDWTEEERRAVAPVPQMMVRTIAQTGRKNLFVASHAGYVVGMDEVAGRQLIDELLAHASQRQFVHTHRWRQHDLVLWDNRCALHRGLPFDDLRFRRDMQRATVLDVANTCEQAGVPVPVIEAA
jgi:alpha-ketoglutarate-dependent 2,4-dichlorophenoxyacetate dioxygenase